MSTKNHSKAGAGPWGRLIGKSPGIMTTMYKNARIEQIVQVILHADAKGSRFVEKFAPQLKGNTDMQTLCNVWAWVRTHIRYVRDEPGHELIQSPGAVWKSRQADCKSMSVLIGSIVRSLGYTYYYRVARYDAKQPERGHIYPIVILPTGEHVVVDAVHDQFNSEYDYWRKQDYTPKGVSINGPRIGAASSATGKNLVIPVSLVSLGLILLLYD